MPAQLPLTFQQQWLWSLLREHGEWKCMLTYGFRLRGPLSVELLRGSLQELIGRHTSLRTRVIIVDGAATQEVVDPTALELECVSVSGACGAEMEANAQRLFADFSDLKADLAVDPLLRFKLLKLSDHEHWLLLATHRLIADCYSVDQMMPELWSLYGNVVRGQPPAGVPDPPQYAAYAVRQQESYPEWVKRHGPYWKQRLAGARSVRWPGDETIVGLPRGTLGRMRRHLDGKLSSGLREVARRERALLATVMLTVYVGALHRFCEQTDFVVPFFVAGRQSQQRSIVGYFSHILYLRMELTGTETFSELLGCVANELFRSLTHQDFGAVALQEPRLLEGTFFQWLTWHPDDASGKAPCGVQATVDVPGGAGLAIDRVSMVDFAEDVTAIPPGRVDAEVSCFDTDKGIYVSGVYRADLFTPQTIERFMDELQTVAEEFAQSSTAQVARPSGRARPPSTLATAHD